MPTIRKVKSKVVLAKKAVEPAKTAVKAEETLKDGEAQVPKKRYCGFCANKIEPKYWDSVALRRYLSDRGRILPRGRSGACAKHQRRIAREIKRARHLALLPFTVKI